MKQQFKESPALRVLVIEDSEDDAIIIIRELCRHGYEAGYERVDSAKSMRMALGRKSWDIIFCDHALPGFDAFAALTISQEFASDVPFIIISGKISEELAVAAMRAGADDYVMKDRMQRLGPVVEREMQRAVERQKERATEQERMRLEEQLRHAQKMEAVGQLAGGIAHDFNNLLTVIISYCTVLLKEIASDNPWHSDVNEIKNAGDRAAVLTKQLLAFGRKQIMQPEVLDLGQIVSGMVDVLSKLLGENIEMQIRITPNLNKIKADAGQLEQVIINLIVNARDAITGAGKVVVAVQNIALDGKTTTRIGELPSGDYLMLSISDDGEGMNEETLSHIFEPFYTTKTIGKGTGLGLSSVFGIASQSGGGIEVQTHPGRGSDFRIYFPCTDISELDIAAEAPNRRTESLEGNETVLIVEDEEVILNMLTRSLERLGYTVLAASHGEEALLVAEKHQGRIDIIITDIVMPKMSGYELVERLVPLRQEMAVLFTTGYDEGLMSDQALTNPQKHLIHKPFVAQDIAGKIRAILDNPHSP